MYGMSDEIGGCYDEIRELKSKLRLAKRKKILLHKIHQMIASDTVAASFKTVGSYRNALLARIAKGLAK